MAIPGIYETLLKHDEASGMIRGAKASVSGTKLVLRGVKTSELPSGRHPLKVIHEALDSHYGNALFFHSHAAGKGLHNIEIGINAARVDATIKKLQRKLTQHLAVSDRLQEQAQNALHEARELGERGATPRQMKANAEKLHVKAEGVLRATSRLNESTNELLSRITRMETLRNRAAFHH